MLKNRDYSIRGKICSSLPQFTAYCQRNEQSIPRRLKKGFNSHSYSGGNFLYFVERSKTNLQEVKNATVQSLGAEAHP